MRLVGGRRGARCCRGLSSGRHGAGVSVPARTRARAGRTCSRPAARGWGTGARCRDGSGSSVLPSFRDKRFSLHEATRRYPALPVIRSDPPYPRLRSRLRRATPALHGNQHSAQRNRRGPPQRPASKCRHLTCLSRINACGPVPEAVGRLGALEPVLDTKLRRPGAVLSYEGQLVVSTSWVFGSAVSNPWIGPLPPASIPGLSRYGARCSPEGLA